MCDNPYEQLGPVEESTACEISRFGEREQWAYSVALQRNVFFNKYEDYYGVAEHFHLIRLVQVVPCSPVLVIWAYHCTCSGVLLMIGECRRFCFKSRWEV